MLRACVAKGSAGQRSVWVGVAAVFAVVVLVPASDFYKAQSHTADRLRELMAARGLSIDGHEVDPAVCLDCFQTRPDQVRAARARDELMASELAAGLR